MLLEARKKLAAEAAMEYIQTSEMIGVGTGSTVNYFIDLLADVKNRIDGAVSSSVESTRRMQAHGIKVHDLNEVNGISVYVDGADESTRNLHLIKGGGGALTREKIVAAASEQFVCIADDSKIVNRLGKFPLPVEVIPMARSMVARKLMKYGGQPVLREGFTTDNGCVILDIQGLDIVDPLKMEHEINQIPGVVTVGLFAKRGADILLVGGENGVMQIDPSDPDRLPHG